MKKMETYPIWEEGVCYPKQEEMRYPKGIRHILAHDGRKDILPFLHDLAITAVNGRLYIAWYNSTNAEICGSSLIRGRWSDDWGETWSEPFTTVGEIGDAEEHFVPVNLFGVNGKLMATITEMEGKNMTTVLDLFELDKDTGKGTFLSHISEGFICNTAPVKMENGNWISPGWMPKKEGTPAFPVALISRKDALEKEWRYIFLYDPLRPDAVSIRCAETTLLVTGPKVLAFVRNDEGPSYIFESKDYGESWSGPFRNPMSVGNSKLFAGELSNGKKYLIYNEDRGYFQRTLLVIAVADAGSDRYGRVYKILEDECEELGRGSIWFYPCAFEAEGYLYVACTLQEADDIRSAIVTKIPVESL